MNAIKTSVRLHIMGAECLIYRSDFQPARGDRWMVHPSIESIDSRTGKPASFGKQCEIVFQPGRSDSYKRKALLKFAREVLGEQLLHELDETFFVGRKRVCESHKKKAKGRKVGKR